MGYQAASEYYKQALEIDPRSVYALVSYGLFKMDLQNYGEAIESMNKAASYCTKKTGYYVYFNLAKVYDQIRDRPNRIKNLRKALEYEPNHTICLHSLGVALSQNAEFQEALKIFDRIIQEELTKPDGPSESLVYAYKTKVITLRRDGQESQANKTLQSAIKELQLHDRTKYLVRRLEDLTDE